MGNCKTLMIANISPCLSCSEHTLNTLRYADRVKELRKEKNERETQQIMNDKERDPSEVLAQMLMMPRQHNKTVKYTVDIKKNSQMAQQIEQATKNLNKANINAANSSNNNLPAVKKTVHINQLISQQPSNHGSHSQNKNHITNNQQNQHQQHSQQPRPNTSNLLQKQNSIKSHFSNNDLVFNNKRKTEDQFENMDNYVSKYTHYAIKSDEDYQKLSNVHETLINQILKEEEEFIGKHKSHIDDVVDVIKQVKNNNLYIYLGNELN
jgi:kinesin family protein 2/24